MPALRVREFDVTEQYPITQAEFRAWLETRLPLSEVGTRDDFAWNSIARYIRARGDGYRVSVGHAFVLIGGKEHILPEWASTFLKLADKGPVGSGIQARTALRLLDRVAHASLPAEDDWERTALESEAVR